MSDRLKWFKSSYSYSYSYSDSQGGECLEVALDWRKSSYSDSQGSNCLEFAPCPHTVHLRDSKLGERSPRFAVGGAAWTAFVAYARHGA